jgi:hypothetical protein
MQFASLAQTIESSLILSMISSFRSNCFIETSANCSIMNACSFSIEHILLPIQHLALFFLLYLGRREEGERWGLCRERETGTGMLRQEDRQMEIQHARRTELLRNTHGKMWALELQIHVK